MVTNWNTPGMSVIYFTNYWNITYKCNLLILDDFGPQNNKKTPVCRQSNKLLYNMMQSSATPKNATFVKLLMLLNWISLHCYVFM